MWAEQKSNMVGITGDSNPDNTSEWVGIVDASSPPTSSGVSCLLCFFVSLDAYIEWPTTSVRIDKRLHGEPKCLQIKDLQEIIARERIGANVAPMIHA